MVTVEQNSTRVDLDRLAAAARSILACPSDVQLVVDGVDDIAVGLGGADLTLEESDGRPVFACPPDSALARAGLERRSALLTLTSGVGRPGEQSREASLTLAGRLETTGQEACECCTEVRAVVTVHLNFVLLCRGDEAGSQFRVPLSTFLAPEHGLNRGYLQRATEHATQCHQDELRRAVATTSNTRLGDVVGVSLDDLTPSGVTLNWVDTSGAHRRDVRFAHRAADVAELGELLRSELHSGLC